MMHFIAFFTIHTNLQLEYKVAQKVCVCVCVIEREGDIEGYGNKSVSVNVCV